MPTIKTLKRHMRLRAEAYGHRLSQWRLSRYHTADEYASGQVPYLQHAVYCKDCYLYLFLGEAGLHEGSLRSLSEVPCKKGSNFTRRW